MSQDAAVTDPRGPGAKGGLLAVALLGIALFLPHFLGYGTFIGDADRLNTWLAMRKFTIDSIREHGRVPAWNDRMFCGYCTSGLHWMNPELDPFAYLEACLPEGAMYRVCGYTSCFLLICAGWAFFGLGRVFDLHTFPAVVGAATYMMGSFAINRITQVDWAYAVLIGIPLGIAVLRRIGPGNWTRSFVLLVCLFAFLIVMTFLQEVAYAFLLLGLFASYQSLRNRSWAPAVLFAAAFVVALIIGLPRLITVAEDFQCIDRGHTISSTNAVEILRWIDDGIFGRYPAEARALGNNLNMHEGFQLYTTAFATLLLFVGAIEYGSWSRLATRVLFCGVLTLVLHKLLKGPERWLVDVSYVLLVLSSERLRRWSAAVVAILSVGVFCMAGTTLQLVAGGYLSIVALGLFWKKTDAEEQSVSSLDVAFFYFVLSMCIGIVLLYHFQLVIHKLFFNIDFHHARIAIAALVPMSLLVGHWLQNLGRGLGAAQELSAGLPWLRMIWGGALGVLALLGVLWGAENWQSLIGADKRFPLLGILQLSPRETFHVLLAGTTFTLFGVAFSIWRNNSAIRHGLSYGLGIMVLGHCLANAAFQIAGPHTWTFPFPFRGNNYVMDPVETFREPNQQQLAQLHAMLETDGYRTLFLAPPDEFFAFVEPHMAEFWRLRVLGGYPNVPKRLAILPWPEEVRHLRSLSFANANMIDWQLLATMNTKYVVPMNSEFYYNVANIKTHPTPGFDVNKLQVLVNPLDVVPRVFFAKRIRPAQAHRYFSADPRVESSVEGIAEERFFAVSGIIKPEFDGDRIAIELDRFDEDRFLVLNELYHPRWHATCDGQEAIILPTNEYMRGLVVPAGATRVELTFIPFSHSGLAYAIIILGIAAGIAAAMTIWRASLQMQNRSSILFGDK